jgi:hypothetical protein
MRLNDCILPYQKKKIGSYPDYTKQWMQKWTLTHLKVKTNKCRPHFNEKLLYDQKKDETSYKM